MFSFTLWFTGLLLFASPMAAQDVEDVSVSLYPTVDPVSLAQALNISDDCLDAL